MKSRLYYECHVTVEPPTSIGRVNQLDSLAKARGWRMSTFTMLKPGAEPPNAFISYRNQDYDKTCYSVAGVINALESVGFKVLRWKIEDTLFDSNKGDTLEMIRNADPIKDFM